MPPGDPGVFERLSDAEMLEAMLELPAPVPADRLTMPSDEVLAAQRAWREERQRRGIDVSDADIDWLVEELFRLQGTAPRCSVASFDEYREGVRAGARADVEWALDATPAELSRALQRGENDLAAVQVAAAANEALQRGKEEWVGHVQYIPEPDADLIERAMPR